MSEFSSPRLKRERGLLQIQIGESRKEREEKKGRERGGHRIDWKVLSSGRGKITNGFSSIVTKRVPGG